MASLTLYSPTNNTCKFKVILSYAFNTKTYKKLRITKRYYGNSTGNVSSYLETRTASSSYTKKYYTGTVNTGLIEGKTYRLYAYAQSQNGTWYLAGSDSITMLKSEEDLRIKSIVAPDLLVCGKKVRFKVRVKNYGDKASENYVVSVYDENNNKLDSDTESGINAGTTANAYVDVTMDEPGSHRLKFKVNGDSNDTEYHTFTWIKKVPYTIDHIPVDSTGKRTQRSMNAEYLTIHSTGNSNSSAKNERNWLTNSDNTSNTAFHIVIDDDEAIEVFPLDEIAYHAGDGRNGAGNTTSIGIEMCESGDRDITLENAINVVAKLLKERGWGIDKLRMHYDWSGKDCPAILRDSRRKSPTHTWDWFKAEIDKLI